MYSIVNTVKKKKKKKQSTVEKLCFTKTRNFKVWYVSIKYSVLKLACQGLEGKVKFPQKKKKKKLCDFHPANSCPWTTGNKTKICPDDRNIQSTKQSLQTNFL